jgi:hypothetical protein
MMMMICCGEHKWAWHEQNVDAWIGLLLFSLQTGQ